MTINRRKLVLNGALAGLWLGAGSSASIGQTGGKTIRIIVPFAPGGSVDNLGRVLAEGLRQQLGTSVIVENRPGASGTIGAAAVAKAEPDGLTWLLTFDTHAVVPALMSNLAYDTDKDLIPVTLIGTSPMLLVTNPSKPYQTLGDVVEHARSGGAFNYGTGGVGTLAHLAMTLIARKAGVTFRHVTYRGGAPAINDAIAGHTDGFIGTLAVVVPQIEGGFVRPIVQTGESRNANFPNVPTVQEAGFAGFNAEGWWGMFAPAKTPPDVVAQFQAALAQALNDPTLRDRVATAQKIRIALNKPSEFSDFFSKQVATWRDVVRENGIKAE